MWSIRLLLILLLEHPPVCFAPPTISPPTEEPITPPQKISVSRHTLNLAQTDPLLAYLRMLQSKLDEEWTKPSMATLDEGFTWLGNRIVNAPSFKMKKQAASDHCSALQAIIFGPASDADVQTLTNSMVPEATAF